MDTCLRERPRTRTTGVRPRCEKVWLRRRHGESGLVLEGEPGSARHREPSAQGHTSLTHAATASSSRSIARRTGTWQDQPLRTSSLRALDRLGQVEAPPDHSRDAAPASTAGLRARQPPWTVPPPTVRTASRPASAMTQAPAISRPAGRLRFTSATIAASTGH